MKHLIWAMLFAIPALGDDTPFLNFECVLARATGDATFNLSFKNDDSAESEKWSSDFKRTKIRFEKTDRHNVNVWLSTGIPVVSYGVPEEFQFSAPLQTEKFHFTFGVKPIFVKGDFFDLTCTKKN